MCRTDKVDIVHVVWLMGYGGIEVLVGNLCAYEQAMGHKSAIIEIGPDEARDKADQDWLVDFLRKDVAPVIKCVLKPWHSFPFRLAGVLRKLGPKAVHHHAYGISNLTAVAARLAGVNCIVETEHNVHPMETCWDIRFKLMCWMSPLLGMRRVAVSEGVRRSMVMNRTVRVVYNGIDCKRFCTPRAARILSECGLGLEDGVVVGHIGTLRAAKNHEALVRIASKVISLARKRIVFVCAGAGERFDEIKKSVCDLGLQKSILLVGEYRNIPEFLGCCDIFFMPSKYEGLPIACIEAMAAGVASVVSDVTGLNEVVNDDTVGIKFPLEEESLAVEAILELAGNAELRGKLGAAARLRAQRFFSIEACVAKYNELYGIPNR